MNKDVNLRMFSANKLKHLRENNNMTQDDLAEKLCQRLGETITRQTVSLYENGKRGMNQDILFALSDIFNISINTFFPPLNFDNGELIDLPSDNVKIPVLGRIPAGMPFEAIEDEYTTDYEEIPRSWLRGGNEFFALKLDGDSMEPEYQDKDVVIFRKAPDCESGQDCCIRINGYDATFKRVKKQLNGIMVIPLNENNSTGFTTTFYTNEEILNMPVEILGVVKQIRRNR